MNLQRKQQRSGMNQLTNFGGYEQDPETMKTMRLLASLSSEAILSYDEFRSLIRILEKNAEERTIVRMFREALLYFDAGVIGPSAFLNVCRDAGLFGKSGGGLKITSDILAHADEDSADLQRLLQKLWKQAYPFFERRLLEIGTRRRDIPFEVFGEFRNRIAEIGKLIDTTKSSQKSLRMIKEIQIDIAMFSGETHLGVGWTEKDGGIWLRFKVVQLQPVAQMQQHRETIMKEMQARERMNRRDNINTTQQTTTPNSQYQQQSVIQGDQFVKYGGTGVQQKFSTSKVEELNPRSFKSRTQDIGPNLYIRKGMQRTQMTQRIQDSDPQNRAYQPASSGQLDQTWLRPYKGLPGYEDFGGKPGLRIFFGKNQVYGYQKWI